ncbi:MAG: LptF/LptG family permease [Bacteroidota bacterium]|nr:LptF/LptG family permease [Bacteroidota bacterium]MDP3144650.1 LptF/LptG family permease [Bacteroidota bacterium]
MLLKKLHTLTLKSFLPPFISTLFISVFLFFLVTIVITYLDEFIGKGLNTLDLIKLFSYAWISLIPQCIPLAVLLASIMSFGNLAENYELAAMKSSGLSLFSIIKPVFVFIIILAGMTFLFNNFILPVVHLKFQSLLYDIRQKKPTVNIKEGIFYNKIDNFSLRVGKKSANKDTLKDIFIYDHSAHQGNNVQMYAKTGKLTTTADTSALVLILQNGNRYEEVINQSGLPSNKKPLSQLNFKQLQVNIELVDFKLKRTDENQFKGHEEMMNIWQIDSVVDSTSRFVNKRLFELERQSKLFFYGRISNFINNNSKIKTISIKQFYDSLSTADYVRSIENAMNIARSGASYIDAAELNVNSEKQSIDQLNVEWHKKIVVCFACIILFFVGAPLGAIIKKGGLGLPVVVAVFFFLAYFILTEAFTSLAYEGNIPVWQAMWTPLVIFLPISMFLTYKAAKDSAIFDVTVYYLWIAKLFKNKKLA